MNRSELIKIITMRLTQSENIDKATGMKAYMKDQYEYYGVTAPIRKELFKSIWSTYKSEIVNQWQDVVIELWNKEQREYQYIAMDIIRKLEKKLVINDLSVIEKLIVEKSWWDTVDFLASHGVGQILKRDKELLLNTVERYINSDNMWLQRTAIIFQLFYKNETDAELMIACIDKTIGSKEFFINKAAGWALRQYSRINPQFVSEYIDLQGPKLSTVTKREASKYL